MEYCFKILHAIILKEAKEVENDEFFKSLVEQFCNVGKIILEKFKISTKFSVSNDELVIFVLKWLTKT